MGERMRAVLIIVALAHRDEQFSGLQVQIAHGHPAQFAVARAGKERGLDQGPELGIAGVYQPCDFRVGQIPEPRCVHVLERLDSPPLGVAQTDHGASWWWDR